jgi:hypothetical protein
MPPAAGPVKGADNRGPGRSRARTQRRTARPAFLPNPDTTLRGGVGFSLVDLNSGRVVAHLEFDPPADELIDVQLLPGVRCPFLSGPSVDREKGESLWTVPPGELGRATEAPPASAKP